MEVLRMGATRKENLQTGQFSSDYTTINVYTIEALTVSRSVFLHCKDYFAEI